MSEKPPAYPNATHASAHLAWSELACHDAARTPYPEHFRRVRGSTLAKAFEQVRAACGDVPLTILSGYRTPEHNRRIGGARASQHVEGRAIDIRTPKGLSRAQFGECINEAIRAGAPIRGVGRYPWGYHIDVRPGTSVKRWSEDRPEDVR
jgi:hypothetical protein